MSGILGTFMRKINATQLASLAKSVGNLHSEKLDVDAAYSLMALHILETPRSQTIDAAIIVHLLVENFILHSEMLYDRNAS